MEQLWDWGGGGGGGTISDSILGGGTRHFFLLNLYNFKNIGGGAHAHPAPYSAVPVHTDFWHEPYLVFIVEV